MDDGGITLTGLTIGGAALTTIGGLVGAYIKARHSRTQIEPQPLPVQPIPSLCEERHRKLDGQIDCLFAAINQQRATAGRVESIEKRVESMDGKLDIILSEWAHQRRK